MKVTLHGPTPDDTERLTDDYAELAAASVRRVVRLTRKVAGDHPRADDAAVIPQLWRAEVEDRLGPTLRLGWALGQATIRRQLDDAYRIHPDAAVTAAGPVAELTDKLLNGYTDEQIAEKYLDLSEESMLSTAVWIYAHAREKLLEGLKELRHPDEVGEKLDEVAGLSEARAKMLARNELHDAMQYASLAQVLATGLDGTKEWRSQRDARVRPDHVHADGQRVGVREKFTVGGWPMERPHDLSAPPEEWANCFPAGTLVQAPGLELGYRRWYEGELVEVTLASGQVLTATPNHPVLTAGGWCPLHLIGEGDDLIGGRLGQEPTGGDPHIDDAPARIEEIVEALAEQGRVERVAGRDVDFHGDGRVDRQVDVVGADRHLRHREAAAVPQPAGEQLLPGADLLAARLARDGFTSQLLRARRPAAAGGVGRGDQAPPFNLVGLGHADQQGGAAIPRGDPGAQQPTADRVALDAEPSGQGQLRLAGEVTLDKVLHVKRYPFAGHVYNLQTPTGWYIANGTVVRNCRCYLVFQMDVPDAAPSARQLARIRRRARADRRLLERAFKLGVFKRGVDRDGLEEVLRTLSDFGLESGIVKVQESGEAAKEVVARAQEAVDQVREAAQAAAEDAAAAVERGEVTPEEAKAAVDEAARTAAERNLAGAAEEADWFALAAAADTHTGAMVGLVPDDPDSLALDSPEAEPVDQLHLTLAYLGDAADWSASQRNRLLDRLGNLAEVPPVAGEVFGVGAWNSNGPDPSVVLNVGGDQLDLVHRLVWDILLDGSVGTPGVFPELPDQHTPWVPHCCLAYTDNPAAVTAALDRVGRQLTFPLLRVAFGGEVTDLKLGGPADDEGALAAAIECFRELLDPPGLEAFKKGHGHGEQPRDHRGRWTDTGAGSVAAAPSPAELTGHQGGKAARDAAEQVYGFRDGDFTVKVHDAGQGKPGVAKLVENAPAADHWQASMTIRHRGDKVGEANRMLVKNRQGGWDAHHVRLAVDRGVPGRQGFADRYNRHLEDWYKANKVNLVRADHLTAAAEAFYSPAQPRGRDGKWRPGGAGAVAEGGAGTHPDLTGELVMDVGLDPDTARRVQHTADALADRYGVEIKRAAPMEAAGKNVPKGAAAAMDNTGTLYVSATQLDESKLRMSVALGLLAPGDDRVEGAITHEYAHRFLQDPNRSETVDKALTAGYTNARRHGYLDPLEVSGLSAYSTQDIFEREAEMFSNYHYGGANRPEFVKAWGRSLNRSLGADPTPLSEVTSAARVAAGGPPPPLPRSGGTERWFTPGFVIPEPDQPKRAAAAAAETFEAPGQPRDHHGRWTDTGAGVGTAAGAETAEANLQGVLDRNHDLATDKAWYSTQHDVIGQRATAAGIPSDTFAGMVAATSPQIRWETKDGRLLNVELAEKAALAAKAHPGMSGKAVADATRPPGMLKTSLANAVDIYNGQPAGQVLKGPKTRSFYNNLVDPKRSRDVTIDRQMAQAMAGDHHLDAKGLAAFTQGKSYRWSADRVRVIAGENHLAPLEAQAAIWTQWRREG